MVGLKLDFQLLLLIRYATRLAFAGVFICQNILTSCVIFSRKKALPGLWYCPMIKF